MNGTEEWMTAKDMLGFPVGFGDYVMVANVKLDEFATLVGAVVRIVKLSESPKGITAVGAYADLIGTGRVSRIPVDIAASRLVMRSNGDALVGTAPVTEEATAPAEATAQVQTHAVKTDLSTDAANAAIGGAQRAGRANRSGTNQ